MIHADLIATIDHLQNMERKLLDDKGAEYAHAEDRLANFKRIGKHLELPAQHICLVYLLKHMDGIISYVKEGKAFSDETIEGRIADARNYLGLLLAILHEQTT